MTEKYERLFSYGEPSVDYFTKETWTDAVKALYKRLQERDYTALAPLLRWDIDFLHDSKVMAELVKLKYGPDVPDGKARAELRKIANVIARRPSRRQRILPHGDQLEAELASLIRFIEEQRLLEVKGDKKEIQDRLAVAMRNPMLEPQEEEMGALVSDLVEEQSAETVKDKRQPGQDSRRGATEKVTSKAPRDEIVRLASIMAKVVKENRGGIRRARSWALQAMAKHYGVDPKQIETEIARERRAGRRRRPHPPS